MQPDTVDGVALVIGHLGAGMDTAQTPNGLVCKKRMLAASPVSQVLAVSERVADVPARDISDRQEELRPAACGQPAGALVLATLWVGDSDS
jgi:hypothetical protein